MNYKKAYSKAYDFRKKFWYLDTYDTILSTYLNHKFQPMRDKLFIEMYKDLYPRRKKCDIDTVLKKLPEHIQDYLNKIVIDRGKVYAEQVIKVYYKLPNLMVKWSKHIEVKSHGELQLIKFADCGNWNSQGISKYKYTRNSLKELEHLMNQHGLYYEVKPLIYDESYNLIEKNQ